MPAASARRPTSRSILLRAPPALTWAPSPFSTAASWLSALSARAAAAPLARFLSGASAPVPALPAPRMTNGAAPPAFALHPALPTYAVAQPDGAIALCAISELELASPTGSSGGSGMPGAPLAVLSHELHGAAVRALAFSPAGGCLLAAACDAGVALWSVPPLPLARPAAGSASAAAAALAGGAKGAGRRGAVAGARVPLSALSPTLKTPGKLFGARAAAAMFVASPAGAALVEAAGAGALLSHNSANGNSNALTVGGGGIGNGAAVQNANIGTGVAPSPLPTLIWLPHPDYTSHSSSSASASDSSPPQSHSQGSRPSAAAVAAAATGASLSFSPCGSYLCVVTGAARVGPGAAATVSDGELEGRVAVYDVAQAVRYAAACARDDANTAAAAAANANAVSSLSLSTSSLGGAKSGSLVGSLAAAAQSALNSLLAPPALTHTAPGALSAEVPETSSSSAVASGLVFTRSYRGGVAGAWWSPRGSKLLVAPAATVTTATATAPAATAVSNKHRDGSTGNDVTTVGSSGGYFEVLATEDWSGAAFATWNGLPLRAAAWARDDATVLLAATMSSQIHALTVAAALPTEDADGPFAGSSAAAAAAAAGAGAGRVRRRGATTLAGAAARAGGGIFVGGQAPVLLSRAQSQQHQQQIAALGAAPGGVLARLPLVGSLAAAVAGVSAALAGATARFAVSSSLFLDLADAAVSGPGVSNGTGTLAGLCVGGLAWSPCSERLCVTLAAPPRGARVVNAPLRATTFADVIAPAADATAAASVAAATGNDVEGLCGLAALFHTPASSPAAAAGGGGGAGSGAGAGRPILLGLLRGPSPLAVAAWRRRCGQRSGSGPSCPAGFTDAGAGAGHATATPGGRNVRWGSSLGNNNNDGDDEEEEEEDEGGVFTSGLASALYGTSTPAPGAARRAAASVSTVKKRPATAALHNVNDIDEIGDHRGFGAASPQSAAKRARAAASGAAAAAGGIATPARFGSPAHHAGAAGVTGTMGAGALVEADADAALPLPAGNRPVRTLFHSAFAGGALLATLWADGAITFTPLYYARTAAAAAEGTGRATARALLAAAPEDYLY